MKRLVIAGVLSLLISLIMSFNAKSFYRFVLQSIIVGIIIFGLMLLVLETIRSIKKKNTGKSMALATLSVFAIAAFSFAYMALIGSWICLAAITPAHFRTNILTGQCDFGGGSSCVVSDPWYFKKDCSIPTEQKVEIFKSTNLLDESIKECNDLCGKKATNFYCANSISYFVDGISCKDLASCDSISCR